MAKAQALIIGAGNFGSTVAMELAAKGLEVTVLDVDAEKAEGVRDSVTRVIVGDATEKELLAKFAEGVDMAIISVGERVDASVLITHFLKELGIKRIIAKATSDDHGKVLRIVGATQTVYPERDEAIRLVRSLVSSNVMDLVRLSDEINMVELVVPDEFVKRTIGELDLRRKYSLHIIGVKNVLDGSFNILPNPDYTFRPDDIMIAIAGNADFEKLKKA